MQFPSNILSHCTLQKSHFPSVSFKNVYYTHNFRLKRQVHFPTLTLTLRKNRYVENGMRLLGESVTHQTRNFIQLVSLSAYFLLHAICIYEKRILNWLHGCINGFQFFLKIMWEWSQDVPQPDRPSLPYYVNVTLGAE